MHHIVLTFMQMVYAFWRQLAVADVAVAAAVLFLSSAAVQRLTTTGPMLWPVFGIIPTLFVNLSRVYDWATDELAVSGGTFPYRGMWFGRCRGVITVDPANVEYMLKTNFANFPKGKYYRERFADFLGDGIFNSDDDLWREQRRAATSEMHSARFYEYSAETIRDLVHNKLIKLLDELGKKGACVDLQQVLLRFTFDNICTAAFAVDPGCLAVDLPEIPFAKAFEQATELTLIRFTVPPFVWKMMKYLNLSTERRLKAAIRTVHEFAEKTVADRRRQQPHQGFDLLSRLINLGFSDKFLKDFSISFILAGRDTSSVALAWFFWLLSKHPRVEHIIVDEINSILKRRREQNSGCRLAVEELRAMEYLQAALSESLRLYPSVPVEFKEVAEDDVLPDGTKVNKGDRVIYSIYSMARTKAIWGEDCKEFMPERWMKGGVFASESQFKYAVFNAGPRLCVGKKFAYLQMKMVAAAVLMRFRVDVVAQQEVVPKLSTTLYMKHGLMVRFWPRDGHGAAD